MKGLNKHQAEWMDKVLLCKYILLEFQSTQDKEENPKTFQREKKIGYKQENMDQTGIELLISNPEF